MLKSKIDDVVKKFGDGEITLQEMWDEIDNLIRDAKRHRQQPVPPPAPLSRKQDTCEV